MAEKKEYVKLWLSYECYFEPYSDVEVGRLVRAMIKYKSSGEEPGFNGNERYIWPAIKRDIDEAARAQEEKSQVNSENGKKGGRPKKPTGEPENRTVSDESPKRHGQGQGQGQGSSYASACVKSPTLEQVEEIARLNRCPELAKPFFDYYAAAGWRDSEGRPVFSWQQKFQAWKLREQERQKPQEKGQEPWSYDPGDMEGSL